MTSLLRYCASDSLLRKIMNWALYLFFYSLSIYYKSSPDTPQEKLKSININPEPRLPSLVWHHLFVPLSRDWFEKASSRNKPTFVLVQSNFLEILAPVQFRAQTVFSQSKRRGPYDCFLVEDKERKLCLSQNDQTRVNLLFGNSKVNNFVGHCDNIWESVWFWPRIWSIFRYFSSITDIDSALVSLSGQHRSRFKGLINFN